MLKKIFIAVGILAVVGIVGIVFLGNKIDSKLKEKEPEFRQYAAMTVDEQNSYVEKHLDEFFNFIMNSTNSDEKAQKIKSAVQQLKNDPAALQAGIAMGRSFVAGLILANEDILKDLSADIHNKLKAEADEFESRSDKYNEFMQKYLPSEK